MRNRWARRSPTRARSRCPGAAAAAGRRRRLAAAGHRHPPDPRVAPRPPGPQPDGPRRPRPGSARLRDALRRRRSTPSRAPASAPACRTLRPARVTAHRRRRATASTLTLDDGRTPARADRRAGRRRRVRRTGRQVAAPRLRPDGGDRARARPARRSPHRAFERFTDEGPLALLPQDGADGHSTRWCGACGPERAQQPCWRWTRRPSCAQLGEAFGERLGSFTARVGARRLPARPERRPEAPPRARSPSATRRRPCTRSPARA